MNKKDLNCDFFRLIMTPFSGEFKVIIIDYLSTSKNLGTSEPRNLGISEVLRFRISEVLLEQYHLFGGNEVTRFHFAKIYSTCKVFCFE